MIDASFLTATCKQVLLGGTFNVTLSTLEGLRSSDSADGGGGHLRIKRGTIVAVSYDFFLAPYGNTDSEFVSEEQKARLVTRDKANFRWNGLSSPGSGHLTRHHVPV